MLTNNALVVDNTPRQTSNHIQATRWGKIVGKCDEGKCADKKPISPYGQPATQATSGKMYSNFKNIAEIGHPHYYFVQEA